MASRTIDPDPTVELGNANQGIAPWSAFYDSTEEVPELAWPHSVKVYDKMRNDNQIAALLLSFMLPILGYRWYIDPNGASDEVVEQVGSDYGLPIEGQDPGPQGRTRDRFSFHDYLYHSLLKLVYGMMFFEQVYRLGDDQKLHIRKYAPRMPGSIFQIQVEPDGGLAYIRQYPSNMSMVDPFGLVSSKQPQNLFGDAFQSPVIPVDRLIAHVNEKEGANWYGRPWTRALYRDYVLKDRALRVDAMKNERNGMGVPTITAPANASSGLMTKLSQLAMRYKSGEASGGAMPNGSELKLNGVSGTLPIVLDSVRYYDQAMAQRFLAMFMPLGTTATGARSLGETFVDFFGMAQESVAKDFADVTTAHGIEDLVDLNYSADEAAPRLCFDPESDRAMPTSDLVAMVEADIITMSDEDEDWVRAEQDMPQRTKERPDVKPPPPPEPNPLDPGDPLKEKARSRITILNAANQRQPTDIEEQSKVDFVGLQKTLDDTLTQLVSDWNTQVKAKQINELMATISTTATTDFDSLATLDVTPLGADLLGSSMTDLAQKAADAAVAEVKAQGVDVNPPDLTAVHTVLQSRAAAVDALMARSISQAASAAALSEAGGALSASEIAVNVADHLQSLTDTYLNDQLGGALMQAQNTARRAVFNTVPYKNLYSSELVDSPGCCAPCTAVNGTEYNSMAEAELDYPGGGYRECLGGPRCRGTIVAVAATESDPSVP